MTRTGATTAALVVTFSLTIGIQEITRTITIEAGESSADYRIRSVQTNGVPDSGRPLLISVTEQAGYSVDPNAGSLTVTIKNIEKGLLVSASSVTVREGTTATYRVRLATAPAGSVVVTPTVPAGASFSVAPASLTFTTANWSVQQTLTVTARADTDVDDEAAVSVTHSVSSNYLTTTTATTAPPITVTVTDDGRPTVSIAPVATPVTEGSAAEFRVTLSDDLASALDVVVSAARTGDFISAALPTSVTVPSGATAHTLTIDTVADDADETDGSVTVTITAHSAYVVGTPDSATVEILDDDALALTLDLAGGGTQAERAANLTFTVTLSGSPTSTVSVDWTTADGTAAAGQDYTAANGTVQFAAGATGSDLMKTFTVALLDDGVDEPDEQFTVTLSNAQGDGAQIGTGTATVTITDDDVPELSIADASVVESGGPIGFPVTLSPAAHAQVTVDYRTSDGSATQPADYTEATGALTFPVGDTTATIAVTVVDDTDIEAAETFTVTLSSASASATLGAATATGTIRDDDTPGLTLDLSGGGTETERAADLTFTVTLNVSPTATVSVDWATADGTAAAGQDYTAANGTVQFAAGATGSDLMKTFTVALLDDGVDEPDEQFTVTLSNAQGDGAQIGTGTATVTITDDDVPELRIADASVVENGGPIGFPVTLSPAAHAQVTVDYRTSDGSATQPADYTEATGALTFSVGDTTATIAVTVVDDTDIEAAETFTVTLSNAAASATLAAATATGTIQDDDGALGLSIGDASATEGAPVTFTVSLNRATSAAVTASWLTEPGTATAADFTEVSNGMLTIAAGNTATQIRVTSIQDTLSEPAETFTVTVESPVNAELAATLLSATGTIEDDDPLQVTIAKEADVTEGAPARFTLSRTGPTTASLAVTIAVTHEGTVLDAGATLPVGATFGAGAATVEVSVATVGDDLDEANGSITVTVTDGAAYDLGTPAAATVVVEDDDLPVVTLAWSATEVAEGGSVPVEVARVGDTTVALTVALVVEVTGEYEVSTGSAPDVDIAAGNSSATLSVTVVENDLAVGDGTLDVTIAPQRARYRRVSPFSLSIPVRENDDTTAVPALIARDRTCQEETESGPGRCFVEFLWSPRPRSAFDVLANTASGTATSGEDFVRRNNRRFAVSVGDREVLVPLNLTDDSLDENDETFTVTVTLADDVAADEATISDGEAVITIADDDPPPGLSIADATASEGSGSIRFVTTLAAVSGRDVVVNWETSDVTATAPADYISASEAVTIGAGTTSANIDVKLLDDADPESNETFQVTITSGEAVVTREVATGRIDDNDVPLTVTVGSQTIGEGESTTVTVRSATPVPTALTITLELDGTATGAGTDYIVVPSSITIAASGTTGTATVTAVQDTLVETGGETISITAKNGNTLIGVVLITIADDDLASFSLSVDPAEITEGGTATSTVTVETGATFATEQTVTLTLSGSAEGSGTDYTISSTSIAIDAGDRSGTATVTPVEDNLVEGAETITIEARLGAELIGTRNISLLDNDDAAFTLSVDPPTITEGAAAATVTVATAGAIFATDQTIALALSGSAAEGVGNDYTLVPSNITIVAGETSGTATVTPLEDDVVEGEETITITASHAGTGVGSADIPIVDTDTATLSLTIAQESITEGDTTTITVQTGGNTFAAAQTIALDVSGSTATVTDDFTVNPQSIEIAAGATSGSAVVAAADDSLVEGNEEIAIAASHDGAPIGSGTIAILDNDNPTFGVEVDPTTIAEGETTTVVVATGGVTFPGAQAFDLILSGTATTNTDYTVSAPAITIVAGDTSGSVTIEAVDDVLVETAETIDIEVRQGTTTLDTASVTISASDQSDFSLTVDPGRVTEGETATVTVGTGGVIFEGPQEIGLALSGSADDGTDYTISSTTITIATGATAGEAVVTTTNDTQVEGNETITIAASHDGAVIGTRNVTIVDNDTARFSLTVDPTTVTEGGTVTVAVDTGGVSFEDPQEISLALSGSADDGTDYTISSTTIMIATGETAGEAVVTITTTEDTQVEGNETITIAASHDGAAIGTTNVTITDNDTASFSLTIDPATIAEGATATVTAEVVGGLTFGTAQTITLTLAGSATADSDYTVTPSTITIPASGASGSAVVAALDDTFAEDEETILITASLGDTKIGTAELSITDDDTARLAFTLSVDPATIAEGETATVTVETGGVTFDVDQTITLALGGNATEGVDADYTITPSSITIAANSTAGSATIEALLDTAVEDAETIRITASHGDTDLDPFEVTIASSGTTGFALDVAPASIEEGATATITVSTGGTTFAEAQTITLTFSGSASADSDYSVDRSSIEIAAGATSGTATITTVNDSEIEDAETITVTASHDGAAIGTRNVTIAASDQPDFSLTVTPATIEEGETATITVRTGTAFAEAQTIALSFSGSASADSDYTVDGSSIEIAAGATSGTATITTVDDSEIEDAETITVTASHDGTLIGTRHITIRDNDVAGDTTPPTVVGITSTATFPTNAKFTVNIEFSESVTGLTANAVGVTNGAATNLQGSGAFYQVDVTPRADFEGTVTVTVPAGAATDAAGNPNLAGSAGFAADTHAPTVLRTTLDRPVEEWIAPTDTGAETVSGFVSYPKDDEDGAPDGAAASPGGVPRAPGSRHTLTLTYDEPLDETSTPPADAFTARADGSVRAVASVAVRGASVQLTLAAPVAAGQAVTVSYTAQAGAGASPIRDLAGNSAHDLAGAMVGGGATAVDDRSRHARVNRAVLPYAAATLQASALAAIAERVEAAGSGASWPRSAPTAGMAAERLLSAVDFVVPLAGITEDVAGAAPSVSLWGAGDYRTLSGARDSVDWSGDLRTLQVGGDLRVIPELLAGVAVAWSKAAFDYTDRADGNPPAGGVHETELVSVHPYLGVSVPHAGLRFWTSAGYGWGTVRIDDNASAAHSARTSLMSAAVGGSGRLLATDGLVAGGTTTVRLKGDGSLVRVEVQESGRIAAAELDTRRLRVLLEGSHAQWLAWGARLQPTIDVGLRYEDGDGPQGAGLELGGRLRYLDPRVGLTVQAHGRLLATHHNAYEEWGAGGLLRLELGAGGRGLWLSVAPSWGDVIGAQGLRESAVPVAGVGTAGRLEAQAGYGFPAGDHGGLLTPYGGLTLGSAGESAYRGGVRLQLDGLVLKLEGTRREGATDTADHGVTLGGAVNY